MVLTNALVVAELDNKPSLAQQAHSIHTHTHTQEKLTLVAFR
jgi:hypothetical protein